jgi:putative peptide zinc metalloprotease protein
LTGIEPRGEIHHLDTSETALTFMLDCYGGAKIRISETAKLVLESRWAGRGFGEIASELEARNLRRADADAVERYCTALDRKLDELERTGGGPVDPAFGFRRTIFSEETAARVARWVTWMYDPRVAVLAVAGIAAAALAWFLAPEATRHPHLDVLAGVEGYALFFVTLFAHEFGHSGACLRYGGRPGRIGVTIYLVLPALFSDVGAAWHLKRWQRVVVDLGGTYFHAVTGAIYVLLGLWTGWTPFFFATALIIVTLIFNMNPIFKFDGYWIVADALGVANLSKQPGRIIRGAMARLRGQSAPPLPWPAATVSLLVLYTGATVAVWGYFVFRLAAALRRQVETVVLLAADAIRHHGVGTHGEALKLALAVFGIVMGLYFVSRLANRAWRAIVGLRIGPRTGAVAELSLSDERAP